MKIVYIHVHAYHIASYDPHGLNTGKAIIGDESKETAVIVRGSVPDPFPYTLGGKFSVFSL
jgi:hypothetical protein